MIEVLGVGDDGWEGLSAGARAILRDATVIVGGSRHVQLIPDEIAPHALRLPWPSPLKPALRSFLDSLEADPVVLASGDPLRSGIGATLIAECGAHNVRIHPHVSSDTLARARMGWPAETVDVVTLVGRSPQRLAPFVTPGARLIVLCSDGEGPAQVASNLVRAGAGQAQLTAWWHLGGAEEGHRRALAGEWGVSRTPDLVVLCVEIPEALTQSAQRGPAPGRLDGAFDHDGLITKRDVRASALARLRPMPGAILWDLGAGSGAVGIEWALAAVNAHAVAIERDPQRADRIDRNAQAWGVAHRVQVVPRSIEDALTSGELPEPDAVFFGGGVSRKMLETAWTALKPEGRLVAHAVTIESELALLDAHARWGGELVRISLEQVEPLGRFSGWRPARSIVSWTVLKHKESSADPRETEHVARAYPDTAKEAALDDPQTSTDRTRPAGDRT